MYRCIFRKSDLYLLALLWKMICNEREGAREREREREGERERERKRERERETDILKGQMSSSTHVHNIFIFMYLCNVFMWY